MPKHFRMIGILVILCSLFLSSASWGYSVSTSQLYKLTNTPLYLYIPANWTPDGDNVDTLIHLHGDLSLMTTQFMKTGKQAILFSLTTGSLSGAYDTYFSPSTSFQQILDLGKDRLRAIGYTTNPQYRFICLSGWSAAFGGIKQILLRESDYQQIDALCMLDTPYASYAPAKPSVSSTNMAPFLRYCREAVVNQRWWVMTHTQIMPGTYASTSETAQYLINNLGLTRTPFSGTVPFTYSGTSAELIYRDKTISGQFQVNGFEGNQANDHSKHLRSSYIWWNKITFPAYTGQTSSQPGFPYSDNFPVGGPEMTWTAKFVQPTVGYFSTASPGGDGYVITVKDPSGGYDSIRAGYSTDSDYAIECYLYCEYRPELVSNGYERVGIFARDTGYGGFKDSPGTAGSCYFMAWDSGNGRLWCGKANTGTLTDFNPSPVYYPSSGWRKFRIECLGSQITYKLDGQVIHTATDSSISSGQFGIGFHELFTTNSNMLGTRADQFRAETVSSINSNWPLYQ